MADKEINDLTQALQITNEDLFVLEQGGTFGQGILYGSNGSKFYKGIPWVGTGSGWRRGV